MIPGPHNLTGAERAEALFGPDWRSPLATVCAVNIRTVERWAAWGEWERSDRSGPKPAPTKASPMPADVEAWLLETLERLSPLSRRAYGYALRDVLRHTADPRDAAEAIALVAADLASGRLPRR